VEQCRGLRYSKGFQMTGLRPFMDRQISYARMEIRTQEQELRPVQQDQPSKSKSFLLFCAGERPI
jgi:hypothetical protein